MTGAAEQEHASANILEVPLPAIEYHGVAMPAMTMRFKRVADLLEAPCVELSNENLEYMRLAVLAAGERDTAAHRDRHDTGSSHVRFSRQKEPTLPGESTRPRRRHVGKPSTFQRSEVIKIKRLAERS